MLAADTRLRLSARWAGSMDSGFARRTRDCGGRGRGLDLDAMRRHHAENILIIGWTLFVLGIVLGLLKLGDYL